MPERQLPRPPVRVDIDTDASTLPPPRQTVIPAPRRSTFEELTRELGVTVAPVRIPRVLGIRALTKREIRKARRDAQVMRARSVLLWVAMIAACVAIIIRLPS